MFDTVANELSSCKHLIMVGSGTLPVTLIHIHQRTKIPQLTAVDTDPEAVEAFGHLCEKMSWNDRVRTLCSNGLEVDFGTADCVYVANLVSPKKFLLEKIAQQVQPGTLVLVRDAVGIGEIFAEKVADCFPASFRFVAVGPGHGSFHSRNLFLVKK
jgi:precorrin-6B methylase 2